MRIEKKKESEVDIKNFWDLGCAVAHVGGNWNNGSNAGPWNWNLNNSSSNANVNIGGRLFISKPRIKYLLHSIFHAPWQKSGRKEQGLVALSKYPEANEDL